MLRVTSPDLWPHFSHDPRDPAYAAMRASDADRDLVLRALGDAYAEGRLTALEFDDRTSAVAQTRVLGDLPGFLNDLVPSTTVPALAPLAPVEVQTEAVARWRSSRNDALRGWLFVSVVCWTIWMLTSFGGHPWPVYPMLGTAIPLMGTLVQRRDMIEQNRLKIVAKQEKAIAKAERKRRELEAPQDPPAD